MGSHYDNLDPPPRIDHFQSISDAESERNKPTHDSKEKTFTEDSTKQTHKKNASSSYKSSSSSPPSSWLNDVIANLPRFPTKEERLEHKGSLNIKSVLNLSWMQHAQFWVGFLAWVCDAYDFFCVSLTTNELSRKFWGEINASHTHALTQSITLTLLFRSVGALVVGLISDRYGRRWPLVVTLVVLAALQLATSFAKTYSAFLGIRAVFGIFMGAIWGAATASALENIPIVSRGIFSGIMQEGYAIGYLLACIVNMFGVERYNDYRIIFWVGAGITLFCAVLRILLPDSEIFIEAKKQRKHVKEQGLKLASTWSSICQALKEHWLRCIYALLLMSFMNFFSHGSQDLYPTFLQNAKGFTKTQATQGTIVGNCGAIFGGIITGYLSQWLGRRLTIIFCCIIAGAFIPLWIVPDNLGALFAGAFMVQVGVQGAWGVIPVYLHEIAPSAFRAVFTGLSYQLGNAVSSASAQIEATAGETLKVTVDGVVRPDYGLISAILIGIVCFFLIILSLIGKEDRGKAFENDKTLMDHILPEDDPNTFDMEKRKYRENETHTTEEDEKDDLPRAGDRLPRADEENIISPTSSKNHLTKEPSH